MRKKYIVITSPTGIVQIFPLETIERFEMEFLGKWKIRAETK